MSSQAGNDTFTIPANPFDVRPFLKQQYSYKPDSFAQKMYILNENICVVFAGDEIEIKRAIKRVSTQHTAAKNLLLPKANASCI
ncbi:MAG TPA: hypothetical protein VHM26_17455 [Chitinophagaceae bacterium]|jgi:hypothetical protein|nr:hypothetical protein [Chitinophagaceae bacterium]